MWIESFRNYIRKLPPKKCSRTRDSHFWLLVLQLVFSNTRLSRHCILHTFLRTYIYFTPMTIILEFPDEINKFVNNILLRIRFLLTHYFTCQFNIYMSIPQRLFFRNCASWYFSPASKNMFRSMKSTHYISGKLSKSTEQYISPK